MEGRGRWLRGLAGIAFGVLVVDGIVVLARSGNEASPGSPMAADVDDVQATTTSSSSVPPPSSAPLLFFRDLTISGTDANAVARGYPSVVSMALGGGEPAVLLEAGRFHATEVFTGFAMSPGGTSLVVAARNGPYGRCRPGSGGDTTRLLMLDMATRAMRELVPGRCHALISGPAWSPDGKTIVYSTQGYWYPGGGLELYGSRLEVVNADGSGLRVLSDYQLIPVEEWPYDDPYGSWQGDEHPSFSPDGNRLVFARTGTADGSGIYTMRLDGSDLRRVLADPHPCVVSAAPVWSPAGDRIAFVRRTGATPDRPIGPTFDIFAINADGTRLHQVTHAPPFEITSDDPVREGDRCESAGGHDVGRSQRSSPERNLEPAWSPDGTMLVFQSNRTARFGSGGYELFAVDPDGSNVRQMTSGARGSGDTAPSW